MRAHISNSMYGVLDYLAQPLAMLAAAPVLILHLGLAPYGLWLIANAVISAGSVVSSGFGDAVTQRMALLRSSNDTLGMRRIVANMLSLNLGLSCTVAIVAWVLLPIFASHVTRTDPNLYHTCLWSIRIGAFLIVIKSVESIFIGAQKAFESYAFAVRIGVGIRISSIAAAALLSMIGFGIISILFSTAILAIVGALAQWLALGKHLRVSMIPSIHRPTVNSLLSFGGFSWLQAVSGVIFSQADRLMLGFYVGAAAVAYYGVAVQMAQPIHGITAAGLHCLFPHLSARSATISEISLRKTVSLAFLINVIAVVVLTGVVVVVGPRVLSSWLGNSGGAHLRAVLEIAAASFAMLALNVTGHYVLLALDKVWVVTALNLVGGSLMLIAMLVLIRRYGVTGAACARLIYGPVTWLMYIPLTRLLSRGTKPCNYVACPLQEEQ